MHDVRFSKIVRIELALFANAHFGPDGTGDFPDPGSFDVTEKAGEFEIRSPL